MRKHKTVQIIILFLLWIGLFLPLAKADPLPSWHHGAIKKNIIDFVSTVTNPESPDYVPPENRIATFDNDGTLWVEQPLYTQMIFAIDRVKALASSHPEWNNKKPFSDIIKHKTLPDSMLSMDDIKQIMRVTHAGMSVDAYRKIAREWLSSAKNPRFHQLYPHLVYQPMLELIAYLKNNHFQVYIVTGGGQEFVRAYAQSAYGIDKAHVIGTMGETEYTYLNHVPELIKKPTTLLTDDGKEKPSAINWFTGQKPIIAAGNSDGDREMLEWTQSGKGLRLILLIHHDDASREYAYDAHSKIGTLSDALMQEALAKKWQIVSMKKDWNVIFPFEAHCVDR